MSESSDENVAVGVRLRRQRENLGLTQEVLAERSGLSVRTISDIERGRTRRPRKATLRQLGDALLTAETTRNAPAAGVPGPLDRGGLREQLAALIKSITGGSLDRPSALIVPLGNGTDRGPAGAAGDGPVFPLPNGRLSLGGEEIVIIWLPLISKILQRFSLQLAGLVRRKVNAT